jgi:hypothetical protein
MFYNRQGDKFNTQKKSERTSEKERERSEGKLKLFKDYKASGLFDVIIFVRISTTLQTSNEDGTLFYLAMQEIILFYA